MSERALVVAFTVLLLTLACCAGTGESVTSAIVFERETIDVGKVFAGRTSQCVFVYRNGTGRPVSVAKEAVGCTCLSIGRPAKPVPANTTGSIVISMTPPVAQLGRFAQTVAVKFDEETSFWHRLRITGECVREVDIVPNAVDFGVFSVANGASKTILIRNESDLMLEVRAVALRQGTVNGVCDTRSIAVGGQAAVKLIADPNGRAGSLDDTLVIDLARSDGTSLRREVEVHGRGINGVVFAESDITNFGVVGKSESSIKRSISLRSVGGEGFRITEVRGSEGLRTTYAEGVHGTHDVTLVLEPGALRREGAYEAELILVVQVDGGRQEVRVHARAFIE